MHDIQKYTTGLHVRHKTWDALEHQLPYRSCVVSQIKKQHKVPPANFVSNPEQVSSDTSDNASGDNAQEESSDVANDGMIESTTNIFTFVALSALPRDDILDMEKMG